MDKILKVIQTKLDQVSHKEMTAELKKNLRQGLVQSSITVKHAMNKSSTNINGLRDARTTLGGESFYK